MKLLLVLLLFLLQIGLISGLTFCFPECGGCNGVAYNQCTGGSCKSGTQFVQPAVTAGGYACVKKTYAYYSTGVKWEPCAISPDIPTSYDMGTSINITVQTLTMSFPTTSTCLGSGSDVYTYFGDLTGVDVMTITHPGVVNNVYYWQVRIIYGMIAFDQWNQNTIITTTFATDITSTPATDTLGQSNQTKICKTTSKFEVYRVIRHDWPYSIVTNLDFTISTDNTNTTDLWGVMNAIVSIRLCHPYCTACFGDGWINVCTGCDYINELTKLSATTCNKTCAPGYGDNTTDPSICILCEPLCLYCVDLPQNCLNCDSPLLLYPNTATNFSCVASCGSHYYANITGNDTCMVCDTLCLNCTSIPTRCTACYLGTYLYQNTCYNPCPYETYADDITQTCKLCNNYCSVCAISSTNCSVCDTTGPYISYLLNGVTCTTNCGNKFYPQNYGGLGPNICADCDVKCITCAVTATNCSSCAATFYLLGNTCDATCPFPAYFTDNATWTCLSCATHCVTLNMSLYWKNSLHQDLVCDLTFSQDLNWTTADIARFLSVSVDDPIVSLDNFNFNYEVVGPRIMRLTLSPKGYTFIYNVTFNFKTMTLNNGAYDYAANMYRFSDTCYDVPASMVWFLIKAPSMSDTEKKIMDGVSGFSTKILAITTLPYVQEIKKAGIFAMLMGGAQITSTACLVNSIPSQNFYEGVRFWASFVFFDVPAWEQGSKKTKYVVVPNVQDIIKDARLLQQYTPLRNRTLFDTSTIGWRFQRTGHTSFFIFDTYINIFLIVVCWILLAISHYCIKHKLNQKKLMMTFYSFTIKVHEITIFYISLSTLLEWMYFDAASVQRWTSLGFCILFNVYFLCYELYVYYDMINYPAAVIGNEKYEYYALRYGSLLKNIRFQEFDPREEWSAKHWFRPYNYHILSYYKKFLMMICLPIFYTTKNAQIGVLMTLQLLEMIRFVVVWPFKSKARNIIRLCLQCCLMVFFMTVIIQAYQMAEIMINNPDTLQNAVDIFYKIGWLGFATCWTFNLGHVIIFIYDTVKGCRRSNREMMDEARKIYYMQRLKQYEEENEDVPLALVNKWVKLGNLNDRKYDDLPDLNLRVEYFRIHKIPNGFEIDMKKLFEVFMNIQFNYQKENNLSAGKKINKRFTLTRTLSPTFYGIIENLYHQYMSTADFQYLVIKTFQKVIQSAHKPSEKIALNPAIMQQRVQLETFAGQKKVIKLDKMLPGFPLAYDDLKQFA